MTVQRVRDLTVEELKRLIREVVRESLLEWLDPDAGLELRPEIVARLQASLAEEQGDASAATAEEVAARLGLKW